jgi:predicted nucleic acid-binding protein
VKLVQAEEESAALYSYLHGRKRLSCTLAFVEVLRAVRERTDEVQTNTRAVLSAIDLIEVDLALFESAIVLDPPILRTLDAIHVAAALLVGDELDDVITYDERMADAARIAGLHVETPGRAST